jgi:hypothetical protein
MTRYFFRVRNEGIFAEDPEGTELLDSGQLWTRPRAMARDFAIQDLMQPESIANRMIEITDAAGISVRNVRARDILDENFVPKVT